MTTTSTRVTVAGTVLALLGAALALVAPGPATAQPAATEAADWVPFVGSRPVGCSLANPANPGCEVHHPTWAVDFAAPAGKAVRAAGIGVVVVATRFCRPLGGDEECNGGAGNMVVIAHGDYWSRYLHLSEIPRRIRPGRQVEPGDIVGRVGASGTFGGPHLHYDEYQPGPPAGRVAFGRMFACHDGKAVLYPDVLGYRSWRNVPLGTVVRNDGYDCTGHPAQPHPPAPEPPVYPEGPPLRVGGSDAVAIADADGDGDVDLVVGVPGASSEGRRKAGMVAVIDPLHPTRGASLVQGRSLTGALERGDLLGAAVTAGDFDCDGRDDLAIGAPGEDLVEPFVDAGAVNVVFGDGDQQLITAGQGLDSYYQRPSDWVGAALGAGDFDADGCDDLAIASPGADRTAGLDMGLVWVMWGSPGGIARPVRMLQGVNLGGVLESHDQTGYALAVGDFDCNGIDDLAVGAPREGLTTVDDGAVLVAYGSRTGLRRGEALYQGGGLSGEIGAGREYTGMALAAGDIDADGCDDLAVGSPGETVGGHANAGAVHVTFGTSRGLRASSRQVQLAAASGLAGSPHRGDRVGTALALVDLDCDGRADLAAGAPGRDIRNRRNAGAILVTMATGKGLDGPTQVLRQGRGLRGRLHAGARVGSGLVAGDVDLDGCGDLAISAPGTRVRTRARAGAIHVWFGSEAGATAPRPMRIDQRGDVPGRPGRRAMFGGASPTELFKAALAPPG